ncbi:MAG: hypothetical protein AABZ31_04850 [Bdellovibrionota bacterium]
MATKADFTLLKFESKSDITMLREHMNNRFSHMEGQMCEMELRLITRLGLITATSTSIAVGLLAWLIKI